MPPRRLLAQEESWRSALLNLIVLAILAGIVIAWASVQPVDAGGPRPSCGDRCVLRSIEPVPTSATWACLLPGWFPGDQWGPGPLDVVPDVPPCDGPTLPPTDTE